MNLRPAWEDTVQKQEKKENPNEQTKTSHLIYRLRIKETVSRPGGELKCFYIKGVSFTVGRESAAA